MQTKFDLTNLYNSCEDIIEYLFLFLDADDKKALAQTSSHFNEKFQIAIRNELVTSLNRYLTAQQIPYYGNCGVSRLSELLAGTPIQLLNELVYAYRYSYWSKAQKNSYLETLVKIIDAEINLPPTILNLAVIKWLMDLGHDFTNFDNRKNRIILRSDVIPNIKILIKKFNYWRTKHVFDTYSTPAQLAGGTFYSYDEIKHDLLSANLTDGNWVIKYIMDLLPYQSPINIDPRENEAINAVINKKLDDYQSRITAEQWLTLRPILRKYILADKRATDTFIQMLTELAPDSVRIKLLDKTYDPFSGIVLVTYGPVIYNFTKLHMKSMGNFVKNKFEQSIFRFLTDKPYPYDVTDQINKIVSLVSSAFPTLDPFHRFILIFYHFYSRKSFSQLQTKYLQYLESARLFTINKPRLTQLIKNMLMTIICSTENTCCTQCWLDGVGSLLKMLMNYNYSHVSLWRSVANRLIKDVGFAAKLWDGFEKLLTLLPQDTLIKSSEKQFNITLKIIKFDKRCEIPIEVYRTIFDSILTIKWFTDYPFNNILFYGEAAFQFRQTDTFFIKALSANPQWHDRIQHLSLSAFWFKRIRLPTSEMSELEYRFKYDKWLYSYLDIILNLPEVVFKVLCIEIKNLTSQKITEYDYVKTLTLVVTLNEKISILAVFQKMIEKYLPMHQNEHRANNFNKINIEILDTISYADFVGLAEHKLNRNESNLLEFILTLVYKGFAYSSNHKESILLCVKNIISFPNKLFVVTQVNSFINSIDEMTEDNFSTMLTTLNGSFNQPDRHNKRKAEVQPEDVLAKRIKIDSQNITAPVSSGINPSHPRVISQTPFFLPPIDRMEWEENHQKSWDELEDELNKWSNFNKSQH